MSAPGLACVKTMTVLRTVVTKLRKPKTVSVTRDMEEEEDKVKVDSDVVNFVDKTLEGSLLGSNDGNVETSGYVVTIEDTKDGVSSS